MEVVETTYSHATWQNETLSAANAVASGDRGKLHELGMSLQPLVQASAVPFRTLRLPRHPAAVAGQELAADNVIAERALARIGITRPVPWELCYEEYGQHMIKLVRQLTQLRRTNREFTRGTSYFYNDRHRYPARGALLYSRSLDGRFTLVALNFSDEHVRVPSTFERTGLALERLHGQENIAGSRGREVELSVPSNYGRIWTVE